MHIYVSALEVKNDVFQMEGFKAVGPNVIVPLFYQKFWHLVGDSVVNFVTKAFGKGDFQRRFNKSFSYS